MGNMSGAVKDETAGVSEEFPLTHWSAVFAAGKEGTPRAEAALAEFCTAYWYPLYAFARRKGHQPADAQDLTQGFFAYLVEAQLVAKANPEKGRFRSFLLGCFTDFVASEKERAQARKRAGGRLIVPLDSQQAEARLAQEASPDASPERLFDRHWALAVLDAALAHLEAEFKKSGRAALFQQLQPFLQGDASGPAYAEVAQRLGTTEGNIKVTVHRLRHRYRELLRTVVSQTVNSPLEVDTELAHLMAALRG
jgi:RNA polymerase sigma-70 factor (ECF subfamily)